MNNPHLDQEYYVTLGDVWRKLNGLYKSTPDKMKKKFLRGVINSLDYHCRKQGIPIDELEPALMAEVQQARQEYKETGGVPI